MHSCCLSRFANLSCLARTQLVHSRLALCCRCERRTRSVLNRVSTCYSLEGAHFASLVWSTLRMTAYMMPRRCDRLADVWPGTVTPQSAPNALPLSTCCYRRYRTSHRNSSRNIEVSYFCYLSGGRVTELGKRSTDPDPELFSSDHVFTAEMV